jgi:hypothetical protein
MAGDNKDKEPKIPTPQANNGNNNCCGGRRQHLNRWNKAAGGSHGKFKGKTPWIENNIFGNTGAHNAANFHHSLKHIADHLQLSCGNEVSEAIRTMTPVIIDIPAVPLVKPDPNDPSGVTMIPVTKINIYLWKEKHKKASVKLDKYEEDMACAFIIIFHQCTPSLKNKIEAADNFPAILPKTQLPSLNLSKAFAAHTMLKCRASWPQLPPTSIGSHTTSKMAMTTTNFIKSSVHMLKPLRPMAGLAQLGLHPHFLLQSSRTLLYPVPSPERQILLTLNVSWLHAQWRQQRPIRGIEV